MKSVRRFLHRYWWISSWMHEVILLQVQSSPSSDQSGDPCSPVPDSLSGATRTVRAALFRNPFYPGKFPLQIAECTMKRRFPLLEHLHAFLQLPDLQFRLEPEKRPRHILLRHFLPPKQAITFRNASMIFLSQPVYLGIYSSNFFCNAFSFRNVLSALKIQ